MVYINEFTAERRSLLLVPRKTSKDCEANQGLSSCSRQLEYRPAPQTVVGVAESKVPRTKVATQSGRT